MRCYGSLRVRLASPERKGMAGSDNLHEERLVLVAYDERIKELFKVFAEGIALGEPERASQDRFKRALRFAKRARNLALMAVQEEKAAEAGAAAGQAAN
jgi:hypothetical protein